MLCFHANDIQGSKYMLVSCNMFFFSFGAFKAQ